MAAGRTAGLVAASAVAVLVMVGATGAVGAPAVTGAILVTDNPTPVRAHSSPVLARNPKDGELVVVETDVRGTRAGNVHLSFDDGRTWSKGGDLMVKPNTDCVMYGECGPYARVAFDKDGVLLVSFVGSEFTDLVREEVPRNVFLARSTDGGRTFANHQGLQGPRREPGQGPSQRASPSPSTPPTRTTSTSAGARVSPPARPRS